MTLSEYRVSLFGGEPGDYRERFDIGVIAASRESAIGCACAVANAMYGIIGTTPRPLHRHKTYELGERRAPGLTDGFVVSVTLGRARL